MTDYNEIRNILKSCGELFEELVALILKKEYPNYDFMHTGYKSDGGKDFFAVFGEDTVWAEAKSYDRNLEMSRIAGTFVMADICKIDRILIFSLSRLTSGAISNLSKFVARHGKTLIVYQEKDIFEVIRRHDQFTDDEFLDSLRKKADELGKPINVELNKCTELFKKERDLIKKKKNDNIEDAARERKYLNLLYKYYSYLIFNEIVKCDIDVVNDRQVECIETEYFRTENSAMHGELKDTIRAFEIFTAEIILRNNSITDKKCIQLEYEESASRFALISRPLITAELLPKQCLAVTFYFKALNDYATIELPRPKITVANRPIHITMNHQSINCNIIGETSYLGKDSIVLNKCCDLLNGAYRKFETVVVYGKSGVGKSRFLYELQKARICAENNCLVFRGDSLCHSTRDFLRRIILGYYNISFDTTNGKIELPLLDDFFIKDKLLKNNISFIESIINKKCGKRERSYARNWLVALLKNNPVTLIIDNVQVLEKDTVELLKEVISDLDSCECRSEIVLSFNTDQMLTESSHDLFLKDIKEKVATPFKIEIAGFNRADAQEYLRNSLDPRGTRNDIDDLCRYAIDCVEPDPDCMPNPLFLKQIVLYLYQRNIIGFKGETLCILKLPLLLSAFRELPATLYETVAKRYGLLQVSLPDRKEQLSNLLWAVLLFGELPENFIKYILNDDNTVLKSCVELGFLKYGADNTLIFEHDLIAHSILLLLENKPYNARPAMTSVGINRKITECIISECNLSVFSVTRLILEDHIKTMSVRQFEIALKNISCRTAPDYLLPYAVSLTEKYLDKYNAKISAKIKVNALTEMIHTSQDAFGTQRTQNLFCGLIKQQIDNYKYNIGAAKVFIELLKFYMYELPNDQKDCFLQIMSKIGKYLHENDSKLKNNYEDFKIWILWARGKNRMHGSYDFEGAEKIIVQGIDLAKATKNTHRQAELEVQYGAICAYLEDKDGVIKHWKTASQNFTSKGIYDDVLGNVYKGYVMLLENDFNGIKQIIKKLNAYYEQKRCYPFLKTTINDFLSNYIIIYAINRDNFDNALHNAVKSVLNRFRSVALTYDMHQYLHAVYKSLSYLKFIDETYSKIRKNDDVADERQVMYILCRELISNYNWKSTTFEYFFPIFKDIAETVGSNKAEYTEIVALIPHNRIDLFKALAERSGNLSVIAPKLKRGIFNDADNKVNLFPMSYCW